MKKNDNFSHERLVNISNMNNDADLSTLGLDFLCTAFDPEAVDFLESLDIKIYKLASHSATNIELLEYMAQTGKQAILSTGMAELAEVDTAVKIFKEFNTPLAINEAAQKIKNTRPTAVNLFWAVLSS